MDFFIQELTNINLNRGSTNFFDVCPILHFWNHASLTVVVFNMAQIFNNQSHFEKKQLSTRPAIKMTFAMILIINKKKTHLFSLLQ